MTTPATQIEAVTTMGVGGIEYGAIPQQGTSALRVAWRSRVSRTGRWFTCGELIPQGKTLAVRGWDGEPIGSVLSVREGLEAVRCFYTTIATGSA